jgi:hypothetical protein
MHAIGLWQIGDAGPARLLPVGVGAERDLEEWIARDPALLEQGLVVVGRQVRLEGGPLDLLALDPQGQWVLIEIKRERLRREVIAQAIDYASCLNRVDPAWLKGQCDAYLQRSGSTATLEALLEQRGRALEDEAEGRDVIIYLVGTGYDPGLERMVVYLAEKAELVVRIVTFSTFQAHDGRMLLAREIHESVTEAPAVTRQSTSKAPPLADLLMKADANGIGGVVRVLCALADELGFYPRTYIRSIMFAPATHRGRCLFVVWLDRRQRDPGVAKAYIAPEAIEQFCGIRQADLIAAVGQVENVMLDQAGAGRFAAGMKQLMAMKESQG